MKHIAIIHFQPLEQYPPVMNFLNCINDSKINYYVFTLHCNRKMTKYSNNHVKIYRFQNVSDSDIGLIRLLKYVNFYLRVLYHLLIKRPEKVIYFETISAWPVYIYKKFIRKKSEIFIHYHEYTTLSDYKKGMKLVYHSYRIENKYLWKRAAWISHTNAQRMELFRKDYPWLKTEKLHILPNYPPKTWQTSTAEKNTPSQPIRIVYVGSLGLENFYLKEFCTWVLAQNGAVQFDIFSPNSTPEVQQYLQSLDTRMIKSNFNGVWYYDLPQVLRKYDVGVILYKGFNQNFTFNETNKLFEYHVCGLDVWFSEETVGIHKHKTQHTYPRIVAIDFRNLAQFNWHDAVRMESMKYHIMNVSSEEVYTQFINQLDTPSQ